MLVNRVKAVKDRVLFFLASISETLAVHGKRINALHDELDKMHNELDRIRQDVRMHTDLFLPVQDRYSFVEEHQEYLLLNPEIALLQYLRAFVPSRNALDIGANKGDVSHHLLSAGYRVFAFEPSPPTYKRLLERFQDNNDFSAQAIAIGAADSRQNLYTVEQKGDNGANIDGDLSVYSSLVRHPMPGNLAFADSFEVEVRKISTLHEAKAIPDDIAVVKIDTEGNDLQVIEGMGKQLYPIVLTEFWDAKHSFSQGQVGILKETVKAMRDRGYHWHIVIYRVFDGQSSTEPRYYCNIDESVEHAWGNALFFTSMDIFQEARKWCASNLRANTTYR